MRVGAGVVVLSVLAIAGAPARADAQGSSPKLVDLMFNTFTGQLVAAPTPGGGGIVQHTPVFREERELTETLDLVRSVSQQIGTQVATLPLGSSSGGFTYGYNESLGTFQRTTQTFGPAFAERAATIGKRKFAFGMNYLHANYQTLDGKDLQTGDIKFNLLHQHLTPASYVEGDVIQAAVSMDLKSDTAAFLANYGVTDRFDIGLVVPVVRVSMDLTYNATILDFATHAVSPMTHLFANGTKNARFSAAGSASGVGDLVIRGKYTMMKHRAGGLAAGLDLQLPSGDSANMLGTGAAQTKVFLIASSAVNERVSPHLNVGYTFSSNAAAISDQVNYVGGLEIGVTPRVTVLADLVGRTFRDAPRLSDISVPHTFQQGQGARIETTTLQTVSIATGTLNTALGAAGVKMNPWHNLLVSAHLLFGLNDAGLRSKVSPVIGIDYSF